MDKNRRNRIAIISIMTYYARQIFDETKLYEFRKSPLRDELLNKKIYVYSAKEDKAIIGYFKVSDILNGNTDEILSATGYDKRHDGHEIVEYYGKNNPNCFALHLYDVTEFEEYLTLREEAFQKMLICLNTSNLFMIMILYMRLLKNGMKHLA